MATKQFLGPANKQQVNFLVGKYGMQQTDIDNKVIFKDSKFLVFTALSATPLFIDGMSGRLTEEMVESCGAALTSITDIKLPNTITSIAPDAFDSMTSLSAITFPHSTKVQTIEANTFQNCQNLKVLKLGFGTTKIEDGAFQNATRLTSLEMPNTLTSIASTALENAPSSLNGFSTSMPWSQYVDDEDSLEEESNVLGQNKFINSSISTFLSAHLDNFKLSSDGTFQTMSYTTCKSQGQMLRGSSDGTFGPGPVQPADINLPGGYHATVTVVPRNASSTVSGYKQILQHQPGNPPYTACENKDVPPGEYVEGHGDASYNGYDVSGPFPNTIDDPEAYLPNDPITMEAFNTLVESYLNLEIAGGNAACMASAKAAQKDLASKLYPPRHLGYPCGVCG